ncbi:alpha/beta hydrolase [Kineosporia mesophila]|nr:alpha/beta hydrolase [Kineosporia mesophila]MCD5350738.1 alpha/beta hydrolase family protein [Kineosporia mesophila]
MAIGWAQVREWKSSEVELASRALMTVEEQLVHVGEDLAKVFPEHWDGGAATAARTALEQYKELLEDRIAEVTAVRRALDDASDAVQGVEQAVSIAEKFAEDNGLEFVGNSVLDVRGVTDVFETEHDADLAREMRTRLVGECVAYVEEAVRRGQDMDTDLGSVLNGQVLSGALAAIDYRSPDDAETRGEKAGAADIYGQPAKDATPAQVKAWWDALTEDEQKEIEEKHPEWPNNRNGLPSDVLDRANKAMLPKYQEQVKNDLEKVRDKLRHTLPDDLARQYELRRQLGILEKKQASLNEVQKMINDADQVAEETGIPSDLMVLSLDISKERAQAVISHGDPDTADHVGVFTPGLTSTVDGMGDYVEHMRNMRDKAETSLNRDAATKGESVAMITWLGYQAPQISPESLANLDGTSVASSGTAKAGGASLANFFQGIDIKNSGADITALGHSYGSTTTGYALQHAGTGVDRVAFFGSPGLGTDDVNDINVPTGQIYYEEARQDGVGDLEAFGKDPTEMKGVTQLNPEAYDDSDEGHLNAVTGHTAYLDEGSTSAHNLGSLVAGQEEKLVLGNDNPQTGEAWKDRLDSAVDTAREIRDLPRNLSEAVVAGAERTAEAVQNGAQRTVDLVQEGAERTADTVQEGAERAADVAEEGARRLAEGGLELAQEGNEMRKEAGSIYEQLTRGLVSGPWEKR